MCKCTRGALLCHVAGSLKLRIQKACACRRNGKPTSLGCFDEEGEAARAYDKMMIWCELHHSTTLKAGITNFDMSEYEKDIPLLNTMSQVCCPHPSPLLPLPATLSPWSPMDYSCRTEVVGAEFCWLNVNREVSLAPPVGQAIYMRWGEGGGAV